MSEIQETIAYMNNPNDNALKPNTILRGHSYTYTIEKKLGNGTFGITYLANTRIKLVGALGEVETTIQVAIKEFFMHDINGREGNRVTCGSNAGIYYNYKHRFFREAQNLSKFNHPHIVKVLETFEENDTAYFAMEFIEGGNLNDFIKNNGDLSDHEALKAILQIGEALSLMHRNKILHLDLKPQNIMRRRNGELVLIDFGLSKQFDINGEPESSTHIGGGTIGYAPIEQANYRKGNGFPATLDIYALGATLFKILTGTTPPEASEIFNDGFPTVIMRKMGINDNIIQLTSWAMEPMKAKRPQSVEEFLSEVKRLLPTASQNKHPQTVTTPLKQSEQSATPTIPILEQCNGLQIRWNDSCSENKKQEIRELIKHMQIIGHNNQIIYSEYDSETVVSYPLMSLCDKTWQWVYPLLLSGNTDGIPPQKTIRNILYITQQLERCTGLPFRLAEKKELRFTNSGIFDNIIGTLYYSTQESSFKYTDCNTGDIKNIEINSFSFAALAGYFDFQLVCDRPTSIYSQNGWFDVPYTQERVDEIQPIGFGLYKIRTKKRWNITSPQSPMNRFLPEYYENITEINIYNIPGPGFGYKYLGIKAQKGDTTSFYQFDGDFKLIASYTTKELEMRKRFT